jgi:hypothetical protein
MFPAPRTGTAPTHESRAEQAGSNSQRRTAFARATVWALGVTMSLLEHLKALVAKQRAYASFFKLGSKAHEELTVVENLLESMRTRGEVKYSEARLAPLDPPDCIAQTADGGSLSVAIEVTELVCEESVRINARQDREAMRRMEPGVAVMRAWDTQDFIGHIAARLEDKDSKKLKGGPYERYIVAIHTDEPLLERDQCMAWLRDYTFGPFQQIAEAYLLFSYMPGKGYEYITLAIASEKAMHATRETRAPDAGV